MVDTSAINEKFGVRENLSEELLQALFEFMMGFYYAEKRFFRLGASITQTNIYAEKMRSRVESDPSNSDEMFKYFKQRYIDNEDASYRLNGLTPNKPRDMEIIEIALSKDNPSELDMISANLMVLIRLRHNIFHANKFSSLEEEPEEQRRLIQTSVDYLSAWLKAIPA